MSGWGDVRELALALPGTSERSVRGLTGWRVNDRWFVWQRPLLEVDREALGEAAPDGEILGAQVESLVAKEALVGAEPDIYFTTPRYDGRPVVLARLEAIGREALAELIAEAWLARAPQKLARAYLDGRGTG